MQIAFIPGWILMLLLTQVSIWVSNLVELGGKHPLEASALAVVFGMLLRNIMALPQNFMAGIKASEKLLILGIVLMGATLDFTRIASQGASILVVIVLTMLIGFLGTLLLGRWCKLSGTLALLLAVGTTICGGTAVAVTAPLVHAKEEETSYAVTTIAIWGIVAILLYPGIARVLGASDFRFGVFAGTAIHSTPQVVGAGFIFSDIAGKTATAIKLIRNCFMAPLALLIALVYSRRKLLNTASANPSEDHVTVQVSKAFPWFLFVFFVMSWCNSSGFFTPAGVAAFENFGKYLVILGMAGVGLNTHFGSLKSVGLTPLFVGLWGALLVAASSIGLILMVL